MKHLSALLSRVLLPMLLSASPQAFAVDSDADGIDDADDNCVLVANSDQRDTNNDGFGNVCDPDLNNDCVLNALDLALFKDAFLSTPDLANWNEDADLDGSNGVNFLDLVVLRSRYFGVPGPGTEDCQVATVEVEAGYGQVATAGTVIQLSAVVEGATSLEWTQIEGTTTALSATDITNPSLVLPTVSSTESLVYELTASNDAGLSASDQISVEVWVGADSTNDLTVLGDFSDISQWNCDQLPVATPMATFVDNGTTTAIVGNGIPDHTTGSFPNSGNPNTITSVNVAYQISNTPMIAAITTQMAEFGVTVDGIKLERDTAESYLNQQAWRYEAITPGLADGLTSGSQFTWLGTDCNNAHVQPTGSYHYHGLMEGVINRLGETNGAPAEMILGGYAADGFPFYLRYGYNDANDASSGLKTMEASWELIDGVRDSGPGGVHDGTFRNDWEFVSGSGDTDECGGRVGVTPEYPDGIYHYYLTDDYPYIPRCVSGTPDPSFRAMMGPPPPMSITDTARTGHVRNR